MHYVIKMMIVEMIQLLHLLILLEVVIQILMLLLYFMLGEMVYMFLMQILAIQIIAKQEYMYIEKIKMRLLVVGL